MSSVMAALRYGVILHIASGTPWGTFTRGWLPPHITYMPSNPRVHSMNHFMVDVLWL